MRAIMPNAGTRIARYLGPLNTAMRSYGIDTNERRAAFLAQISVESSQLHNVEENLNYSAPRLRVVWPRRFRTDTLANTYAHDPDMHMIPKHWPITSMPTALATATKRAEMATAIVDAD